MKNYCLNCRKELEEGQKFCTGCGTPVQNPVVNEPVSVEPQMVAQPQVQVQPQVVSQPQVQSQVVSQPAQVNQTLAAEKKDSNVFAIVGFVLAIISLLCCGATGAFGLIFSIIGLVESKKKNGAGKGLSIAGIVISSIMVVLLIIFSTLGAFADILFA